jgi:membrane protease YdiL (CAAX protease family)
VVIRGYFIEFLSKNFDYVPTTVELPEFSVVNFILVTITLCILPAITEEIAFRGVVLKGVKCGNIYVNALIGGLLFSIFHMNPAQTPYQFAMGFCFSLIAIKSKSSLPVMLAHFLNNFIVVVVEYFFVSVFSNDTILMITTITGLILLALFLVFIVRDKGQAEKQDNKDGKQFFIYASIGIIICVAMWTINLIG